MASVKQSQLVVGRLQIKIIETTYINNIVLRRGTWMTKGVDTTVLTEKMFGYFRNLKILFGCAYSIISDYK